MRRPVVRPAPRVRPTLGAPAIVELISVGMELLRGRLADANAAELARRLSLRGASVRRIVIVGDDEPSIVAALSEALGRQPHLVILTGGLGPALDDRTAGAVAEALQLPMAPSVTAREMVEAGYRRLEAQGVVGRGGLTAAREKMCHLPVGAEPIPNAAGVAPGILCTLPGGAAVLALPGRPDEAIAAFEAALPLLRELPERHVVAQREVEAPTADESALRPLLDRLVREFPNVWINSRPSGSRRRGSKATILIEAAGPNRAEADVAVDGAVRRLLALAAGSP